MIRINDEQLIDELYHKYNIDKLFEKNMKEDLFLVKFEKGEIICREGDPLKYLHFMVEGKIKVNQTQENGKSRLICFVQDFEILGYIEFFAESEYISIMQAVTDVYCLGLDLSIYKTELVKDPKFLNLVAKKLAKTVLVNNEKSSFNLLYPLETRLTTYILLTADGLEFKDNLTIVAEQLTTSYRHLTRILSKLCEEGILIRESNYFKIIKLEALKEISNQTITHI